MRFAPLVYAVVRRNVRTNPSISRGLACGDVLANNFWHAVMQGRNVMRAWEDKPEAARYALMLRAEDLPLGKPTELPMTVRACCKGLPMAMPDDIVICKTPSTVDLPRVFGRSNRPANRLAPR